MKLWNRRSIAARLTRMNLLVTGTALLVAYVAFVAYDVYALRQNLITSLESDASILGSNSITALLYDDPQSAGATLSALRASPHVLSGAILDENGKEFARYDRVGTAPAAISERLAPGDRYSYWLVGQNIVLGRRIDFSGKTIGSVYLVAETSDLIHHAWQFGIVSACILLLCFLVAIAATAATRRLITQPLTELTDVARVVSRDRDYSVRAHPPHTSDELAFLVESFNEMLGQIEQRDAALDEARKALEQRVEERTAELTAANRELEAFSYSVAHDLRGPLQHISNITFLLQSKAAAQNTEAAALIAKLFEASRRMSLLIDDLLNLSRATSTPLHRTAINLSEIAENVLKGLQAEDPTRHVNWNVAKGAHAIADEGLLLLVLENLLRNSWKYTARKDGAQIEFGFADSGPDAVYFVRDNGVGFNPRFADRLFRPFQRLHAQSDFPGTGVGLATVQRIIARHGGKIWAESAVDQGAKFSFTIPVNPAD